MGVKDIVEITYKKSNQRVHCYVTLSNGVKEMGTGRTKKQALQQAIRNVSYAERIGLVGFN